MTGPFSRHARSLEKLLSAGMIAIAAGTTLLPASARAQWSTTYEQFYLQADHNWQFRDRYQAADRMFNAFDYGHAILYETLWTQPNAPVSVLEHDRYEFLTKRVLVRPPRVPLEEGAIEIRYAQLAPEAKVMFEWAHILHRQIYDVLADERLSQERKDAEVARLVRYYRTRSDVAFSSRPKSMALMQEQPYSLAFRQRYPKFNGLIWAYHWLQVGLYEPLMVNATSDARQAGVRATVARFWQMLSDPPRTFPHQMPMTAAVAPEFTKRYPEAAIIFDNLHSMHDVISDILTNPAVARDRKRAQIQRAARLFRDDTSYVMPVEAWRTMAQHMGIENMGGPAVGFLAVLPTPTVTYGAVMSHDERTGAMTGFKYGSATGGAHAQHGAAPRSDSTPATPVDHAAMGHGSGDSSVSSASPGPMAGMQALHERMMNDRVIRQRVLADTALHRLMSEMMGDSAMRQLMSADSADRSAARAPRRTNARAPVRRAPAVDPHAGHGVTPAPRPAPPRPAPRPAPRDTSGAHKGHSPP